MPGKRMGKWKETDPVILAAREARRKAKCAAWRANNKDKCAEIYKRHDAKREHALAPGRTIAVNRLLALKTNTPCADCGGQFHPCAMDYDHVKGAKLMSVSSLVARGQPWSLIQEEIDKCELVCSNCHRVRTWKRWQEAKETKRAIREAFRAANPKYSRVEVQEMPSAFAGPAWKP